MKRILMASTLALAAGGQALAADLPPPMAPPPRAPAMYIPVIPPYNWSGFYVGGNLGAGWNSTRQHYGHVWQHLWDHDQTPRSLAAARSASIISSMAAS